MQTRVIEPNGKAGGMEHPFTSVFVSGIGASVVRATELALQFKETYPDIHLETTTFTVPIEDKVMKKGPKNIKNLLADSEEEAVPSGEQVGT